MEVTIGLERGCEMRWTRPGPSVSHVPPPIAGTQMSTASEKREDVAPPIKYTFPV